MEHTFGREAPYRLGMEEELFLVEPDSRALAHEASELLPRIRPAGGSVIHDTYEALVETTSPIVDAAPAGARSLADLRDALRDAGATLLGAGLHPAAEFADVVHVPAERYRAIAEAMRGLLERTPTAAHPRPRRDARSGDSDRRVQPRPRVPARAPGPRGSLAVLARPGLRLRQRPRAALPRLPARGHPPFLRGLGGLRGERAGLGRRRGDARLHVSVVGRAAPPEARHARAARDGRAGRLRSTAGLAALVHALAVACARGDAAGALPPGEAILESSFRAGRDGLAATVWWDGALRPLPEAARAALAIARPVAAEQGADALLDEVERILRDGNGADRMRAAHAAGGMPAVLERLLEETAEPL